ncbi:hypothetical protein NE865_15057 [Phthorimaea operculella]|nr:hypothetical protein NE865_15057 [Phthorimaea operculella]
MARSNRDPVSIVLLIIVFALPLTLLVPGFSVWHFVPKVRVTRFHAYEQEVTWNQLNAGLVAAMIVLFCLFLEIRKRKLDEMVESVLTVSQATDKLMEIERERQTGTVRACLELLDASNDHYEHLSLLRQELRQRKQHPPVIEPSGSSM